MTRREFLVSAGTMIASGVAIERTRLVLLGTGGGPTPKPERSAPAYAVVRGDRLYVIDCGDGVARQLAQARLSLRDLRAIFITHHHSDHNADYANLLLFAWIAGVEHPVDAYGPPPLARLTALLLDQHGYDIATRRRDEGRPPIEPLLRPREIHGAGVVMDDGVVKVTAALNSHPPVSPSFAYRVDTEDRSIVFSGDTARSDAVVALARGADVLVHEVMYVPRIDTLLAVDPNAARLKEHLLASHTSTEDVGRVAAAARVKTVVLSHFVPGADPAITDDMWAQGVSRHFTGRVIVGRDLMEI